MSSEDRVAIVGIGCRFPGGIHSVSEFWDFLCRRGDAITDVPENRWNADALYSADPTAPGLTYARRGGFLDQIDQFDPDFFGISPREAAYIDPQQRLLLETAHEAMEDAGECWGDPAVRNTGVFVGVFIHDYQHMQFGDRSALSAHTGTGTAMSITANRVSYAFDLHGPSVAVDTACSSSLVAIHMARQAILSGECEYALAGGVNVILRPEMTIAMSKATMLSPDGACKSFDARANGYVRGEGAGLVLLRRERAARAAGNRVYAVLIGSGVNSDGSTNGISVPNGDAQEALSRRVLAEAAIAAKSVAYVEAHGTGTPVGDPIEAAALGRVFSEGRDDGDPCLVGSVKSGIGHLESASGVAGLIKTALCLKHGRIPPNLHFETPNPAIDFAGLKLQVVSDETPWPERPEPRRAAVNSFGFGGTNAHVLVEQASSEPDPEGASHGEDPPIPRWILPMGAHAVPALRALASQYAEILRDESTRARDLLYTVSQRRTHGAQRAVLVANSADELRGALEQFAAEESPRGCFQGECLESISGRPVFVFSGMGPQWWGMARELIQTEPIFRSAVEEVDACFAPISGWSVLEQLLESEATSRIQETAVAQPAIFAVQAALVALWRNWGIEPGGVIGHSVGEIAGLYCCGALSLEEAARVAFHRSRLQATTAGSGGMLAAALTPEQARACIEGFEDRVSIAAINSPQSVSLSGDALVLEGILKTLEKGGTFARGLNVEVPYHSQAMDPIRAELLTSLASLQPGPARVPYYSTADVEAVPGGTLGDADYWWRNVRGTVQFAAAVQQALEDGQSCFLEIGPHPVLSSSLHECLRASRSPARVVSSLRRGRSDWDSLAEAIAQLHVGGVELAWKAIVGDGRLVELKPYPWQRARHWAESPEAEQRRLGLADASGLCVGATRHPLLGGKLDVSPSAWLRVLRPAEHAYLRDHCIQGSPVFPGTGFLELALQTLSEEEDGAGLELGEEECLLLADVEIGRALHLTDEEEVRLQTSRQGDRWEIRGSSGEDGTWLRHAWGRARRERVDGPREGLDLGAVRERCVRELPSDYAYRLFCDVGLDYGPAFQCIEELHYGPREALARLKGRIEDDEGRFLFHPALFDACLHTIFGALNLNGEDSHRRGNVFLPVSVRRVRCHRALGGEVWSHARIRRAGRDHFVADVHVYDAQQRLVAEVLELRCQALDTAQSVAERRRREWMFEYAWVPEAADGDASSPRMAGTWLALVPTPDHPLVECLERRGAECIAVLPGPGFARLDGAFQVDPSRVADLRSVFAELSSGALALRGIAYGWPLTEPGVPLQSDLWEGERLGALGLIHWMQALGAQLAEDRTRSGSDASEAEESELPSLWVFTQRTQAVTPGEPIELNHCTLWGLRRVLANERPELSVAIVDADGHEESWEAAAREMLSDSTEDELAFRAGERYVHRLQPFAPALENPGADAESASSSPYAELRATRAGDLGSLSWVEVLPLELANEEVEIQVEASGLNFKDVLKAAGLFPSRLMEGNLWSRDTLGMECAGRIVRVGSAVTEFAVGQAVMALAPRAFATRVVARRELVVPNPGLDSASAAAIPVAFLTAAMGLEVLAGLKAGERVLIHAGTGGVGQAAIQIAQNIGAEVFATAGSPAKRDLLRELGVKHVFDSRSLSFADQIRTLLDGDGVDVVLNSLAGEAISAGLGLLRDYGRFVELGKLDLDRDLPVGLRPFTRCISFHALDLDRMLAQRVELCGDVFRSVAERLQAGRLRPLPITRHDASRPATAFETMASATHTGKLVVAIESHVDVRPSADQIRFRDGASYLVTGGLGGFGLQLAQWLAARGAGHLILLGRRGMATPGAEEALRGLAAQGCTVQVEACDIADADAVARVLASVPATRPLRGVFHAAAVLDDALIENLEDARYRQTFEPKAVGAWNLHLQTRDLQLDHFMCFSSMASVLGNQGSGNYCAANAFVDALAHHRRQQGLPALTVNWGVIADVGMAAEEDFYRQNLERMGLQTIHSDHCLELLGLLLQADRTQTTVCPIRWSTWTRFNPAGSEGRLREVLQSAAPARVESAVERALRETLEPLDPSEREAHLASLVRELLAAVLRMDPAQLDPSRSLTALGVDSLLGIEIKNRLDAVGLAVSVTQLLGRESAETLTARLAHALGYMGESDLTESAEQGGAEAGSCLIRWDARDDAELRLICFPYAGGNPGVYQPWMRALPSSVEVVSVDFRQREVARAAEHFRSIPEAAEEISRSLVPLLDRPFALFGHCMGAIVMYEVAQRLQAEHGLIAKQLFASGCMAPHLYNSPLVHEQDESCFLEILHLISFDGTRALTEDAELRDALFPGLRRDFQAVALYGDEFTWRPPLRSPITGIAADRDLFAAPKAMRAWDRYSTEPYDLALLSGDHYFVESQRDRVTSLVAQRLGLREGEAGDGDSSIRWTRGATSATAVPVGSRATDVAAESSTFQPRPRSPETPQVLCFPPVGVPAEDFARLCGARTEIPHRPVEWNAGASEPARSVEEMVERVWAEVVQSASGPTLFYGHCIGAIVAYELALRLEREGARPPEHLIAAGAVGPHLYVAPDAHVLPEEKLIELLRVLRFPGAEQLQIGSRASEANLIRVRADLEAMARYEYEPRSPLRVPITAVAFRHDLWSYPRRADTWQAHTTAPFTLVEWPGDHYYAMSNPSALAELISKISDTL